MSLFYFCCLKYSVKNCLFPFLLFFRFQGSPLPPFKYFPPPLPSPTKKGGREEPWNRQKEKGKRPPLSLLTRSFRVILFSLFKSSLIQINVYKTAGTTRRFGEKGKWLIRLFSHFLGGRYRNVVGPQFPFQPSPSSLRMPARNQRDRTIVWYSTDGSEWEGGGGGSGENKVDIRHSSGACSK